MSYQSSLISKGEIYIPNGEFNQILQMSADQSLSEKRQDLFKEKLEMHLVSQNAVKNWGNTLQGQRKKRLLSIEEKAKLAEEQRLAIDRDWAILKANERNLSIERARNLQRMESQKYKTLHSQLLLQSVLMERDLQIERKSKALDMKKQASNIVSANPFLKSEEEEAMAQQANRTKIFEIAAYQKSQREQKRNLEENQKKAEFDYYVKLNIDNSKELGRGKDIAAKKTFEFKESYGKELQNIIESKKIMMDKAKEEARMLDLENERFHQRKSYIAAKHKELTDSRSEAAKLVHDKISPMGFEAENEKRKKIEDFIQKSVSRRLNDKTKDRNLLEKEKREAVLRNINIFRKKQLEVKKKAVEIEREEEMMHKKQIDEEYSQYVKQKQAASEKKNSENMRYKELQLEQIKQKMEQNASAQKHMALDHSLDEQQHKFEDAEFEKYANSVLDEWKSAGRPARLISQSIQKLKEHRQPKERYVEGIKLDTFARLGFSS